MLPKLPPPQPLPVPATIQDRSGMKFNEFTVLYYAGRFKKPRRAKEYDYWWCQCSCGRCRTVSTYQLGVSKACRLCYKERKKPKPEALTCPDCKTKMPFDEDNFYKNPKMSYGLMKICKKCSKARILGTHLKRNREIKLAVLSHYSGGKPSCACCGVDVIEFLTLDHKHNDGAEERKRLGKHSLYIWCIKNNFPDRYQVLCFNCNIARHHCGGTCPHKGGSATYVRRQKRAAEESAALENKP